jgi:hypothetical protein
MISCPILCSLCYGRFGRLVVLYFVFCVIRTWNVVLYFVIDAIEDLES